MLVALPIGIGIGQPATGALHTLLVVLLVTTCVCVLCAVCVVCVCVWGG